MRNTPDSTPLAIDCLRAGSDIWSGERLRHLADRPLRNRALAGIEERRRHLASLPPLTLHPSYAGVNDHAGQAFVTPGTISLPRRYGRLLYSIAAEVRPRLTLEAGAGLGISGMYLAAAAALTRTGRFLSFEIGDYFRLAEESIRMILPGARVIPGDFGDFPRHLEPEARVDLCFLDSRHDFDTVVRDYKSLLGWLAPRAVVLVDDVMSTPGSRRAWEHVLARDDFPFAALIQGRIGFLAR
ncbi:class I SAM-dependent methyltransferase [Amaricoccus solimangrovi]|uniref:Class I SAM-dependent methyltransferase n=1 Tax=Amaricoccus solimangrovi TaxID=2589815 RepID=A0A501WHY2_9RHOB|nr:class I SAM-dependent methyltransferase [Amaricoccus solimangrovi]TPE48392.1 class I SAM-dependent methyltransferase [Amaricoccus solimangrovi]